VAVDARLEGAAVLVQPLELGGERARLVVRVGEQEAPREVDAAHATRGVETRREAETHVLRLELLAVESGDAPQRRESRQRRLLELREAVADEEPVLADERDHVGDRAERGEREPLAQRGAHVAALPPLGRQRLEERARELERDARARESRARMVARQEERVHDRERRRRDVGLLMVVGHEHVDAGLLQPADRRERRDAVVDRDEHGGLAAQHDRLARLGEAVAVDVALRHVDVDDGAHRAQHPREQARARQSVDVGVAEDEDRLLLRDRALQPVDRDAQVGQLGGRRELGEARLEEGAPVVARGDAARREDARRERDEAAVAFERPLEIGIDGAKSPDALTTH
jgi:hypothetical protein